MSLSYDLVIATRNRPRVLKLCLELLSKQTRQPQEVTLVDSSDDAEPVKQIVADLEGTWRPIKLLSNQPRGLTVQRNIGLKHCLSDVVVFPDDDSLFYSDAMAFIMEAYECDEEKKIGGVCGAEATSPPIQLDLIEQVSHKLSRTDQILKRIAKFRYTVENWTFPDPLHSVGRKMQKNMLVPNFIQWPHFVIVPMMTGFRMSFRRSAILRRGFNELLHDYGLYEDVDASFSVAGSLLLAGARQARVYHHKAPERRAGGFEMGLIQIINRVYVIRRHTEINLVLRWRLFMFFGYKFVIYLLGAARSQYGKERLRGYVVGLKNYRKLIECDRNNIDACYTAVLNDAKSAIVHKRPKT
jgi:glycosyltransferase involved in cell wall biosynthesis